MDNQQVPKADSKFQKIARKNHRKWKLRLLSKGGQKASSGGSPFKEKPDYNRAKSAPPGFGGSLEESEELNEVIRKKGGKYCLFSKKTNRNLGCYPSKAGAMKRERQVQYFKHLKETVIREELERALLEEGLWQQIKDYVKSTDIYKKISGLFGDEKDSKLGNQEPNESLDKIKNNLKSEQQKEMADIIYEEFKSANLHPNIALAAIVNAHKESGLNPDAIGDNGHSIGLFQLNDRGAGAGMSVEERQDPRTNTKKIIDVVNGNFGSELRSQAEQGADVPELAAIFARDIERPADKEGAMTARRDLAASWLAESKKIVIKFGQTLQEGKKGKEDRCVRIAKRKYKAWPSAYASGAVVKCRQGKIWKSIKEEEELEEDKKLKHVIKTKLASALSGLTAITPPPGSMKSAKEKPAIEKKHKKEIDEEWSEKYKRSIDCKNPKGFSQRAHCQGRKKNEEVELEERKLGKPSSETNLGDWFKRKGAPGKKGGWVDCNTCRDGKCKPCGRQEGESRSKYPRCRPTPSQCKGYKRRHSNLQKEED